MLDSPTLVVLELLCQTSSSRIYKQDDQMREADQAAKPKSSPSLMCFVVVEHDCVLNNICAVIIHI